MIADPLMSIEQDAQEMAYLAELSRERHDRYRTGRLYSTNHTDIDALLRLPYRELPEECQLALRWRRAKIANNAWMKRQRGYLDKFGIAIGQLWGTFNGIKFTMCGHHGHLCKEPDYCNKCNLDQRVEPALYEYGNCFDRAPFWYALTMSSNCDPAKAGLHLVTEQDAAGKPKRTKSWYPIVGQKCHPRYSAHAESGELIERITKIPFRFVDRLRQQGLIGGAYTTRELDLDFRPTDQPHQYGGLRVMHTALAHGHALINTEHEPSCDLAYTLYLAYLDMCLDMGLPAWPDLHISPITDQKRLNNWISYELKPMPFNKWYCEAVVRGCELESLNLAMMQTVFYKIKNAFGNTRSPNKSGNMFPLGKGYLGKQLLRLKQEQIQSWCHDKSVQNMHPEWEDSVIYWLEKKLKRRGQNFLNTSDTAQEYEY